MITSEFVRTMARYNTWQNSNLYSAADEISDEERRMDRGAFFGSIHETLSHLVWGDQIWMHRFSGAPKPVVSSIAESVSMLQDWEQLKDARHSLDQEITNWSESLKDDFLQGNITWHSGALGRDVSRPTAMLVAHMFNHQTHHRGQVHAMLTAAGTRPEDTDLFAMP